MIMIMITITTTTITTITIIIMIVTVTVTVTIKMTERGRQRKYERMRTIISFFSDPYGYGRSLLDPPKSGDLSLEQDQKKKSWRNTYLKRTVTASAMSLYRKVWTSQRCRCRRNSGSLAEPRHCITFSAIARMPLPTVGAHGDITRFFEKCVRPQKQQSPKQTRARSQSSERFISCARASHNTSAERDVKLPGETFLQRQTTGSSQPT